MSTVSELPEMDLNLSAALARVRLLTARERAVFVQLASGIGNRPIAKRLGITEDTVKAHVGQILSKLQLCGRAQAAVVAFAERGSSRPRIAASVNRGRLLQG